MSKEKQIEEIAKAMCGNGMPNGNCARDDEPCGLECVYGYCAERLYCKGYRKQEWISVEERLPEDVYKDRKIITVLVCTKSGRVSTSSRVRMMMVNKEKMNYEYTDIFEWSGQIAKKVTHWMPLPEAPKMKGGAE